MSQKGFFRRSGRIFGMAKLSIMDSKGNLSGVTILDGRVGPIASGKKGTGCQSELLVMSRRVSEHLFTS